MKHGASLMSLYRNSILRTIAAQLRHGMTNLERPSLMDHVRLVNSGGNGPLSPRRGDEISPLIQSIFFVLSFYSFNF